MSTLIRQPEAPTLASPQRIVRPLRLLLVEDHGVTAQMIRAVLTEKGHSVEIAGDVSTALELAGHHTFDLLLSDLGLPDGSGYDLIRELRLLGHRFPGIALSGFGQEQDIHRSYDAGFAAHLTKPASREALEEAIASVMAGNGHPEPDSSKPAQSAAPVFDAEAALERCFGRPEMLKQMVDFFPKDATEVLSQMHAAIGKGDIAEVGRVAHRFKGTALYLGAQPAADAAATVEQAATSGDMTAMTREITALERQVALLREALASQAAKQDVR